MLEILYQDEYVVAINKPAGLLVHRSMIDRYETQFAVQLTRDQVGQSVYLVHRLDKPTSGVLLFALDPQTAKSISAQFLEQQVKKTYLAVVRGYTDSEGCIDYALKEELDKMTDRKAKQEKEAQSAITEYKALDKVELPFAIGRYKTARYALLQCMPKTGRKHQIRRHMKHIFHPIVGDTTHGDGKHNRFFREYYNVHRLLLHANSLSFFHPLDHHMVKISAGLDHAFTSVLDQWNMDVPVVV